MTGTVLAAAAGLAAVVVAVAPGRGGRRAARRLARVVPPRPATGTPRGPLVDRVRLVAGLSALAVALLAGSWWGLPPALVTGVVLDRLLRRFEPPALRARLLREAADLPLAADLLAVALRGGAPVDRATAAVGEALPGPLGERFTHIGRLLSLGAEPATAWQQLAQVPGGERVARAVVRSADHGGALAGTLRRIADDLRADRVAVAEAAARRAAVLVVLPLGLCFLPAFMLAGLVPVVVAVLGDVL